ncbi:ribose-5-phosphate isomerase [Rothia kristinae]|uniref:ribose-5-phosphate isomerase n=1 Tax=Rothia kristinae TaxID=37923 RepID=UPI001CD4141A|nr:ribose-5-phosphate isomerase [Rothia kristinae]MCA1169429.1 ribose-5-phosphate isomerase [Rothia kristinae]
MRIHIATDHAGLELSRYLVDSLTSDGHELIDHGPQTYDPQDDYPAFCIDAAIAVRRDLDAGREALGIVLGGSGNGEQMAANKVPGIRAALIWSEATAALAREHNDAQIAAVGGRQHEKEEALQIIRVFLSTSFSGDERHVRRIGQIGEYERTGGIAGSVLDADA